MNIASWVPDLFLERIEQNRKAESELIRTRSLEQYDRQDQWYSESHFAKGRGKPR